MGKIKRTNNVRVHYNSPVILTFSIVVIIVRLVSIVWPGFTTRFFTIGPSISLFNPLDIVTPDCLNQLNGRFVHDHRGNRHGRQKPQKHGSNSLPVRASESRQYTMFHDSLTEAAQKHGFRYLSLAKLRLKPTSGHGRTYGVGAAMLDAGFWMPDQKEILASIQQQASSIAKYMRIDVL